MSTVALSCRCGAVRGTVTEASPSTSNHVVCYCADCQAAARFSGSDGVLNDHGGTDIVQVAPGRVHIEEGRSELRCFRLGPKGMHRWYTACCRTPVGNTIPGAPFVGLVHSFVRGSLPEVNAHFGEPSAHIHGRDAYGDVPAYVHPKIPFGAFARIVKVFLGFVTSGARKPSPFFHPSTNEPIFAPRVLTANERADLERLRPT